MMRGRGVVVILMVLVLSILLAGVAVGEDEAISILVDKSGRSLALNTTGYLVLNSSFTARIDIGPKDPRIPIPINSPKHGTRDLGYCFSCHYIQVK